MKVFFLLNYFIKCVWKFILHFSFQIDLYYFKIFVLTSGGISCKLLQSYYRWYFSFIFVFLFWIWVEIVLWFLQPKPLQKYLFNFFHPIRYTAPTKNWNYQIILHFINTLSKMTRALYMKKDQIRSFSRDYIYVAFVPLSEIPTFLTPPRRYASFSTM